MFSSTVLSSFLVLAILASTALAYPAETKNQSLIEVITTDDVTKQLRAPQGAVLSPLSPQNPPRDFKRYTFGKHDSNDECFDVNIHQYGTPRSVQQNVLYRVLSKGQVITYIQIDVDDNQLIYITSICTRTVWMLG